MNRKAIERATREQIREVLKEKLSSLEDFMYAVTRKGIGPNSKNQMIVSFFSSQEHWDVVDAEIVKVYKRLTGKSR